MMLSNLSDIKRVLKSGGSVIFIHHACRAVLITRNLRVNWIDKRSYHGFLKSIAPKCERNETGSTEEKNLTIQWYIKEHHASQ